MNYYNLYKIKKLSLHKNINFLMRLINIKFNWTYIGSTYLPRSFKNFKKEKKIRRKIYILKNVLKEKIQYC